MSDRTQAALAEMARRDPALATRLVLQTLPAVAARIPGRLRYDLTVAEVGTWRVSVDGGAATVEATDGEGDESEVDFRLLTDILTLSDMAGGANPARLVLDGRVRIRGKRRRALKLRAMGEGEVTLADAARASVPLDHDAIFRSLEYLIDPAWTRGHRFTVAYSITPGAAGTGGRWYLEVRDGEPLRVGVDPPEGGAHTTVRLSADTYRRILGGEITPVRALQTRLTEIDGPIYPSTLLGRWIERSRGRDEAEQRREERQRLIQAGRPGTWGAVPADAAPSAAGQGDPAHQAEPASRGAGDLLSYGELYALWERQNWRVHELDFSVDKDHWLTTPAEGQESLKWSLGSFYVGEERVTADLAPFLLAAPTGEVEIFLATQLVDEARHAAFFDRFGAEVMALEADSLRGRMGELEAGLLPAWRETFDDGLRDVAERMKARPDDLDLFVEGIATYHLIVEGVLAMTGQHLILTYMQEHDLYPGFCRGFSLVERDEHRHIAFGVRFLRDAVLSDPHLGRVIERRVAALVPAAAHVLVPPYAESPERFVSFGHDSGEIYGFAYRNLKRRMAVIGCDLPPAAELMPGPVAELPTPA